MGLSSRPPTKRPVYRSEFVIRLQSMREKRGKNFAFDLLDEPIDWRPSPALSGLSLKILIEISQNLLSKFQIPYKIADSYMFRIENIYSKNND